MAIALDLDASSGLEDRQRTVADFLNAAGVTPFREARVRLSDGTSPSGRRPRLIWLIDEIVDRSGESLPDLAVLGFDLSPGWMGFVRLTDVEGIELTD